MNQRKTIAIFGSSLTSRYKTGLCRAFNIVAEELDVDLVYFNAYGKLRNINSVAEDNESAFIDYVDLDQFDGIVFDGEGYNVNGMSDTVERKLRKAKCPVISISSHIDGFHNIEFDDAGGLRAMVEHFIDHHHFTRIGFMSGYLTHPDAQVRLEEFRSVMRDHGLPEDGVGMFEGDFWYDKGKEAAHYFLSLPERPEAIVCANDYMAISLINAFRQIGIKVPEDIAVSGYDGTPESREFLPHLSSVSRERKEIARKALRLLIDASDDKDVSGHDLKVSPKAYFSQSCGCEPLEYQHVLETVDRVQEEKRMMGTAIYESESAMVKLNKADSVRKIEAIFAEDSVNFGEYTAFFMMVHTDSSGRPSFDSEYTLPTGKFRPIMWIDKNKEYTESRHSFDSSCLIPDSNSDRCHIYYLMVVHYGEKIFGYSAVEMAGKDIFNEFHNVWLHTLGLTLDGMRKSDKINKLIEKLEGLSVTDGLTGLLNRRGFDDKTRKAITGFTEKKTVCTMVIDMDKLKQINDKFGHYEGDRAIRALSDCIKKSCESGEIAGRAGGDEFYIFAPDYSEASLNRFCDRMRAFVDEFNKSNRRDYKLDYSIGAYITECDSFGRFEDYLKISDARMYEQKMSKPGRRN
ncbi:MAG: GGDEF domain-containing protein [Lachnospiraceae bacterium]|nr:GGDEF domain-containing protein [Lachnospiraceae bacterium]